MKTVSSSTDTLQDVNSVSDFLTAAATEAVPLFEHLESLFHRVKPALRNTVRTVGSSSLFWTRHVRPVGAVLWPDIHILCHELLRHH